MRIVNGEIIQDGVPNTRPNKNTGGSQAGLKSVHRSIRLAHSLSMIMVCITALLYSLLALVGYGNWHYALVAVGISAFNALKGGIWLHGVIPPMLQEGGAPTDAELASAPGGIFSLQGITSPAQGLSEEWESSLENLAFVCTYGKRNCITSAMYSGEITLGKIASLVGEKLGQGVLVCR